jgi:hypothetical protein
MRCVGIVTKSLSNLGSTSIDDAFTVRYRIRIAYFACERKLIFIVILCYCTVELSEVHTDWSRNGTLASCQAFVFLIFSCAAGAWIGDKTGLPPILRVDVNAWAKVLGPLPSRSNLSYLYLI